MDWTYSSTRKTEKLLKAIKKRNPKLYHELIEAEKIIVQDPRTAGEHLKGDLKEFMAYDFTYKGIAIRICYEVNIKKKACHIRILRDARKLLPGLKKIFVWLRLKSCPPSRRAAFHSSEASPFWRLIWHGFKSSGPVRCRKVCWDRRSRTA